MCKQLTITIITLLIICYQGYSQSRQENTNSKVWVADIGDGTYKNPILYADYSDPDIERIGDDYYMVASSFNCVPGIPVLHSKDLVNWELIGYVFQRQMPEEVYSKAQPGKGAWAPSIRYHNGEFYVYWPDPDFGIYLSKAKDPAGPWSQPLLVKEAKGWIDPCPLWDENGDAWLVSALAGSRAGAKSVIIISRMAPDGTKLLDDGVIVFDGHANHPTIEGPKLYQRNGYYYISAPAGGVPTGWQIVLRSKNIYGPYEEKVVLHQGDSQVNGPHQGGWVEVQSGEYWFIHFQDKGSYGRIVHLEPMKWIADWPVIGIDSNHDGIGEPVLIYKKPNVGKNYPVTTPLESDEFDTPKLGLQWQWNANPGTNWAFPTGSLGFLRMICVPLPEKFVNFLDIPNLLLQKFPAPEFMATTKVTFYPKYENERIGLIVMGLDYSYLAMTKNADGFSISQEICKNADKGPVYQTSTEKSDNDGTVYLRITVKEGPLLTFSYSIDGKNYNPIGEPFKAREGLWIGAKVGIFASRPDNRPGEVGYADFDWFRVEPLL